MSDRNLYMEKYITRTKILFAKTWVKDRDQLDEQVTQDYEGFWSERAKNFIGLRNGPKVLDDSNKPFYKWFVGGKTKYLL